jgi:hypothetical protein
MKGIFPLESALKSTESRQTGLKYFGKTELIDVLF